MAEERVTRKLAAIFYADVAGYSRLTGEDEEGTHRRVSAYLDAITTSINKHNGKVLHFAGDAVLADFTTVSDALICAANTQTDLKDRNKDLPDDRKVQFRVGVNLGEVIVDRSEIFGNGVNVAARLESLAEPGGICISDAVHDAVGTKLPLDYEFLGEQSVKNIAKPVRAYAVRIKSDAMLPPPSKRKAAWSARTVIAAALALTIVVAGLVVWIISPTSTLVGAERPPSLGNPQLSIAVLPFANLSGDKDQDYFADALTEDLTADLSRISGSFVISRRTAATFRGQNVDAERVARELKVRYLLEGTVRRGRSDVRVSVQLTDGKSGQQVWSERYEKTAGDMYVFQNEVTGRVARALNLELKEAVSRQAARGDSGNLDANDLALRAWAEIWNKPQTPATNSAGLGYVRRTLELDPDNAEALGVATYAYARAATYGWEMSRADAIRQGIEAGERSITLDPKNADAVYALGFIYYAAGDTKKSLELMRQCIELNRNHAPAYFFSGVNLIRLGKSREAIKWVERAFALSPRDPLRSVWYATIGRARLLLGDDARAIETAQKGVAANRNHPHNYAVLASAYAHVGQMDKAKAALKDLKRVLTDVTISRYLRTVASTDPVAIKSYQRLMDGLRKAGLTD
jgi:adenylate cyclase